MRQNHELKAGVFILGGLVLAVAVIFAMGKERQIFASQEAFLTTFTDVKGLAEGAPVRLGGITVGRVGRIGFSKNVYDSTVHVTFLVNDEYLDRIHADCIATIETQGLLGDRFLSITPGRERKLLPPGATMRSSEPADISEVLSKAGQVVDNTVEISNNVNEFVQLLRKDSILHFNSAMQSIANLSNEIEKGEGFFHRLVYSKKDGEKLIDNISSAAAGIKDIVKQIEVGSGALHALIYDPEGAKSISALTAAAENLASASASVEDVLKSVKNGSGLMHDLIYSDSPEGIAEVIAKLNATADNLKRASDALAQGSGTLGALLMDPQLYDNLVEVTDEAKRSYLLRQAIRTSLDK
ncbi:MAG: MCE family protein [Deltaproteobacteria bacterium]|nr:MCE family protein [Deltaproteobacteria bacterium]